MDLYERHPALAIPNEYGVPEPPERVHWDNEMAQRVGVPLAYDYGPERVAWLGHLVTDWMGDEAMIEELYVEVRRHNLLGDLVRNRGRVREVDLESRRVHLELTAENQRGESVATGWAIVNAAPAVS
jgi:acyl dehydratase